MFSDSDRALLKAIRDALPPANALTRKVADGTSPRVLDSGDGNYLVSILRGIAAKVGAPIDEQAIAASVLAGLKPAVADAVKGAVAAGVPTDQLADAVVARLGERLAPPA